MRIFIPLTLANFRVSHWVVSLEWAAADTYQIVGDSSFNSKRFSNEELEQLYAEVFQTIDGELAAYEKEVEQVRFKAVDSSFWEVESRNHTFLELLRSAYGEFEEDAT